MSDFCRLKKAVVDRFVPCVARRGNTVTLEAFNRLKEGL